MVRAMANELGDDSGLWGTKGGKYLCYLGQVSYIKYSKMRKGGKMRSLWLKWNGKCKLNKTEALDDSLKVGNMLPKYWNTVEWSRATGGR